MVSILNSIKQMLGVGAEDTNFDQELILHINGALMVLNQLGIGPVEGFVITGAEATWKDFVQDRKDVELIKSNIFIRVKLMFDPPQNSFLVTSLQKQLDQFDWRLEVQHNPELALPVDTSETED